MASRRPVLSSVLSKTRSGPGRCWRCKFHRAAQPDALPIIPSPTPFVPDSSVFLSLIGRGFSQHSSKIPTWQSLFTLTGKQLQELGVEPARSRKYLLWWRERFRRGIYGPGGDLKYVTDGKAELRIAEVPNDSRSTSPALEELPTSLAQPLKRIVVNETAESLAQAKDLRTLQPVDGMRVKGHGLISGPFVMHNKDGKGRVATITRAEGMWEVKRGHKVDGGERRQKEVRRKRHIEANKNR